eukprot:5348411-Prymnesium_polylepis.2
MCIRDRHEDCSGERRSHAVQSAQCEQREFECHRCTEQQHDADARCGGTTAHQPHEEDGDGNEDERREPRKVEEGQGQVEPLAVARHEGRDVGCRLAAKRRGRDAQQVAVDHAGHADADVPATSHRRIEIGVVHERLGQR